VKGFIYNTESVQKIHFIGIAGVGMSGIAMLLAQLGFVVSGSDLAYKSEVVFDLKSMGIKVFGSHSSSNVQDVDIVVISSAISQDNIELKAA
jgi:UDP-N-acetylmuramate--alanine ligase